MNISNKKPPAGATHYSPASGDYYHCWWKIGKDKTYVICYDDGINDWEEYYPGSRELIKIQTTQTITKDYYDGKEIPAGATHYNELEDTFYKLEGGKWFFFDYRSWVPSLSAKDPDFELELTKLPADDPYIPAIGEECQYSFPYGKNIIWFDGFYIGKSYVNGSHIVEGSKGGVLSLTRFNSALSKLSNNKLLMKCIHY